MQKRLKIKQDRGEEKAVIMRVENQSESEYSSRNRGRESENLSERGICT